MVEDYKVSKISRRENALRCFCEFRIGCSPGIGIDRLMDVELLFGKVRLGACFIHAGNRRVQSTKWRDGFNRVISSERQVPGSYYKFRPGVRGLRSLCANSGFRPVHVCEQVVWLHRGNDIQFTKTRNIAAGNYLSVFNAKTEVECRQRSYRCRKSVQLRLPQSFLKGIQGHISSAISNRVKANLETCSRSLDSHLRQLCLIILWKSGVARLVCIGLHQRGGT